MTVVGETKQVKKKYQVKIGGMHCSFCASSITKVLSTVPGVEGASVSLAHEEALVQYDPRRAEPWQIDDALRSMGYTVRDPNRVRTFEEEDAEVRSALFRLLGSAVVTFAALGVMSLAWLGIISTPMPLWAKATMISLAFGNVFGFGLAILKMAYQSLRRGILNQHVLMEFAAFGGIAGGFTGLFVFKSFPAPDFFAIAIFITSYHLLGGYASLRVRTKTSQAVRRLLALQPPTARVMKEGGKELVLPIDQVAKGDLVRVRPGESIPIDGAVVGGYSTADESLVTGESIPAEKSVGEEVIGGSVNLTGSIVVRVTRIGEESFLQQVARYIEEAKAMKPGVLQLLDVALRYFVPGVITAAVVSFAIWSVGAWAVFGHPDIPRASFAALAALVMGYPCALGMATPLAMIRGGGMAAEKGILFRSSEAFHVFNKIDTVVLDKTGTITHGKPTATELRPLDDFTVTDLLTFASSAEALSEHPLAKAVVKKAEEEGIEPRSVVDFEAIPGKGIKSLYGKRPLLVGKPDFLGDEGIATEAVKSQVESMEGKGQTTIAVAYDGKLVGLIGLSDTIKQDASETIAELRKLGMESVMITGDNERTAQAVASEVGIERVLARVLPNQKADKVRELQRQGHRVLMVGDGINDAPALMQADIGVAIGAGTDIAIESADVIVIGDRLGAILDAYHIGTSSYSKTKQNLAIAFSFNGVGVPAAVTGLVQPIWAMVAMLFSVTLVLANSFGGRLVPKPKKKAQEVVGSVTLNVPSMHCETCVSNVMEAISDLEEVVSVEGDAESKVVLVRYRLGGDAEGRIRKKVADAGHVVG